MKNIFFKIKIALIAFALIQLGCSGNPVVTDSKNPPPQGPAVGGYAGVGLVMNLVNLATGNLVKSKTNININFGMQCISDRFSLELKSNERSLYYQEFSLAQQSKIQIDMSEGVYQMILKKITDSKYIVKTDLRVTAENRDYSIKACD